MTVTIEDSTSIVIATKDRCDDLRRTLSAVEKLDPPASEVIVCLDGCTDQSEQVISRFPNVTCIKNPKPIGSVGSRDRLIRLAKGEFIISLDDDSAPTQIDFVSRVRKAFREHPECGVLTFFEDRDPGNDDRPFGQPQSKCYVNSYPNCAGAFRRRLYGEVASYPTMFVHMYEEPDFCLQVYGAGYAILFLPDIIVHHSYSPSGRNMDRRHRQHARNEFWSVLMRCPFPHLLWLAPFRIVRQFLYAASNGFSWWVREPLWWASALKGAHKALSARNPVSWSVYKNWIMLGRNPIQNLSDLEVAFPNVRDRINQNKNQSIGRR